MIKIIQFTCRLAADKYSVVCVKSSNGTATAAITCSAREGAEMKCYFYFKIVNMFVVRQRRLKFVSRILELLCVDTAA